MADETLDDSLLLAPITLVLITNNSVREASTKDIPLIGICNKLLLCNNFTDSLTYLPFFLFKCCEFVVLCIILLEVARELSRFCKMVRRSKVVGPRCVTSYTSCDSLQNWFVSFQFTRTSSKIFGFPVKATLSTFLIIHIQFKDVSNQRKSEAQSHFLYNKAEPTPKCNLCSVMQKELVQAPRAWSTIWNQSTESM